VKGAHLPDRASALRPNRSIISIGEQRGTREPLKVDPA